MIAVALHMGLELLGSLSWACVRGRCAHRHHRIVGDGLICLLLAIITVHVIG